MIQQTAPIIAKALLHSLYAGVLCYLALQILLGLGSKVKSIYKYHLSNIALLIPLVAFLMPLEDIQFTQLLQPAPVSPVSATTLTDIVYDVPSQTNATVKAAAQTPVDIKALAYDTIMSNSELIALLYLAGLMLFSIRLLVQYNQSRNLKTKGLIDVDERWLQLLAATKTKLNITGNVAIAFTKRKISPCIIGHAKAIILIPVSIANNLTTEQAEAILLHELAHYKQYDHYINLLTQCIKCILFFNPFVWLLAKVADKYRELSCDETATSFDRNIELAETLALIAGMHTRHNSLMLNLKKRSPLFGRVQALLQVQQERAANRWVPFVVMTFVLTTGVLLFSSTELFSKKKDSLRDQLQDISDKMYKEGNIRYVFVDAVLDSVLVLPDVTEFIFLKESYMKFTSKRNGLTSMTGAQGVRYTRKLQRFFKSIGEDTNSVVMFHPSPDSDSLTLGMMLDKNSAFRDFTQKDRYLTGLNDFAWTIIFEELERDKFITRDMEAFRLSYSSSGVLLNGEKLREGYGTKYREMFKDVLGLDLDSTKDSGEKGLLDLHKYLPIGGKGKTGSIQPTREEFDEAIRDLYEKGDTRFLAVQLAKDDILQDGESYHMLYEDGVFSMKGEDLTEAQQKRYADMLEDFRRYHRDTMSLFSSSRSTMYYSEVADPNSSLRRDRPTRRFMVGTKMPFSTFIVNSMHREGLIDTAYQYSIVYSNKGLMVNKKKLTGPIADKYIKLFMAEDQTLDTTKSFSYSFTANHGKSFPTGKVSDDVLKRLSDSLFRTGNQGFVIVDAMRDGYIRANEQFKVSYTKGRFSIKGKNMPENARRKYEGKLERFSSMHGNRAIMWGSVSSKVEQGNISEKDYIKQFGILYPKNIAHKTKDEYKGITMSGDVKVKTNKQLDSMSISAGAVDFYPDMQEEKTRKNMKRMVTEMHADKLLDSMGYFKIEYQTDGVYVNANHLSGTMGNKYVSMLNSFGYRPGKGQILERIPEGVVIPDRKVGNTVFHIGVQGDNLPAIADKMFTEGNPDFILAHAMHDGIIKERKHYNFMYDRGVVTFDGKVLPEPQQSRYVQLMEDFFKAHKQRAATHYSSRGGGVTVKDLNDPESTVRKNRVRNYRYIDGRYYTDYVVDLMVVNGLIDTSAKYELKYNWQGLKVNGEKLDKSVAAEYVSILEEGMGHKPRFPDDAIIIKSEP